MSSIESRRRDLEHRREAQRLLDELATTRRLRRVQVSRLLGISPGAVRSTETWALVKILRWADSERRRRSRLFDTQHRYD